MNAIVLCGGNGEKIWPYNKYWQKCCLPVGNEPNLVRIVKQLNRYGIENIILLTGYLTNQVSYIMLNNNSIKIVTTDEDIAKAIVDNASDHTIVYYGDTYVSDVDFLNFLEKVRHNRNVMLLKELDQFCTPQDNICAQFNGDIVESIFGHPRPHYVNTKICGLFALERDILDFCRYAPETFLNVPVGGMPPKGFYLEQVLQTAIENGRTIYGIVCKGNYSDIDFPWDILTANQMFCSDYVSTLSESKIHETAKISDKATINGNIILGENSYIGEKVVIKGNCIVGNNTTIDNGVIIEENTVIGDNTIIKDYAKISANSVIGNHNKIGFHAEVSGVTFDRVAIVHGCQMYGIIGRSTDIAAGCQVGSLRFDDLDTTQTVMCRKYTGNNTNGVFIGDFTRTGISNLFFPGVKIGSNAALGPGLIVSKDIGENKLVMVSQQTTEVDWNNSKYGW